MTTRDWTLCVLSYTMHNAYAMHKQAVAAARQERYRCAAALARVDRLIHRQIHMMCYDAPGRLGHARWLQRELRTVKAILHY